MNKYVYDYITKENLLCFSPYLPRDIVSILDEYSYDSKCKIILIGALTNKNSCGAIFATLEDNTMTIKSIFVDESVRRQKVGTALLKSLLLELENTKLSPSLIDSEYYVSEETSLLLNSFFASFGFSIEDQIDEPYSSCYKIWAQDIKKVPSIGRCFREDFKKSPAIIPIEALPPHALHDFINQNSIPFELNYFKISESPIPSMSLCYYSSNAIYGYIVFEENPDGIILKAAYVLKNAPVGVLLHLITSAVSEAIKIYGEEFYFYINPTNDATLAFVKRVSGGKSIKLEGFYASAQIIL